MIRTYRDQAIILRTYKLGEADRVLILLTRNNGQVHAVAKGVRRTGSKFGSRLSSFNLVDAQFHRGASLDVVTQVETISAYSAPLAQEYADYSNAKLVVEVAQKLSDGRDESSTEQFDLLHGALNALCSAERPSTLVASAYLLRAMALEGWMPELERCVACGQTGDLRRFSAAEGGAFCEACAPPDSLRLDAGAFKLMACLMASNWQGASQCESQLWAQVHNATGAWSQYHLEQRLRSLQFAASNGA